MHRELWLIMLISGVLLLILSLALFFIWGIPNLIDEISGRKAKRQVRLMHELNASTGVIDRISTGEIYSSISNGALLNEEVGNVDIPTPAEDMVSTNDDVEDDLSTSYVEDGEDVKTSYIDNDDFESTTYINTVDMEIILLEEQISF